MKFIIVLWAVVWVLIAFAFMGLFADAYAWDYYKTMGTQYNINPKVCIMLPNPDVESRVIEIQNATTNALDEWQTKLKDHTDGNWTIYREIYEWQDHGHLTTDDFDCGAFVNYSGQVDSYMAQHGVLGTAEANIDKGYYWLEIQTQVVKRSIQIVLGGSLDNSTSGVVSEPKPLPLIDIENIIKHEFGHALGLEHFYCNDNRSNCIDDSIMYGKLNTFTNSTKSITERDLNMVVRMYGIDGFGSPHPDIPIACIVNEEKTC
jgi:predicted Zn-dependent protease